ncbi:hypothetical protein Daus18300_007404 [Diaporthe australafricana]|uniref:ABC transporter n=1 Tax=Diaporthe australafricana TaxID=127596 RepID=A0ABR3WNM2_9PEZI
MGFSFAQPFFIQRLIRYLQGEDVTPNSLERNLGYGLIGASFFIYLGIAMSTSLHWYLHFRTITRLRGTLATAIFAKTRELSSHSLDDSVLTLMSTDVSRVVSGINNVHELWANTIEVAIAAWLLERQLGAAFVAPIVVVVICVVCTAVVAKGAAQRQGEWTKKTQNRVSVTSNVIGHIKAILISGRAEHLASMVQKLRDDELRSGNRFRILMVFSTCVAFAPMLVSPLMTFAVTARTLDTAKVYASLAYSTLLASPLTQLFQTLPNMLASKASLERIQTFLATAPRVDYRVVLSTEKPAAENAGKTRGGPTISLQNVSLGWEEAKWQLSNLNMAFPSSELTIIRGPVASGKSTLSRALLGEVTFVEGKIGFSSAPGKIGLCAQTPFLTNGTIRSNIVGFEPFDSSRYESVLQATLLKFDLDSLPDRDETRVGSGGLTLSGGQKQRVALARALYLDTDLYILDNALSGLDNQTADEIVHRVLGPTGLLREKKTTIVWCTESTRYLPLAHQLIVLGANNTLEYCGSPEADAKQYVAPVSAATEVVVKTTPSVKPATRKPKETSNARHDGGVYAHYRAAIGPSVTAAVLVLGCCFSFSYNFGTVWLNFWAEDVFRWPASQSRPFYLGIYALFQLSGLITLGIYVRSTNMVMATRGGSHLHLRAIRSLFSMPLSYFAGTDRGATTTLFSQDMTLVDGPLSFAISNTLLSGFTALGQAAVVAVATPWVASGYPVLLGVLYLLQRYYLKTSRQLRLLDLESKSPLYAQFQNIVAGIESIRAFEWVDKWQDVYHGLLDTSMRPQYLLDMIQQWLTLSLNLIVGIVAVAVTCLSTQLVSSSRAGLVGAGLVSLMTFGELACATVRSWVQLETSLGAVKRLKDFEVAANDHHEDTCDDEMDPPRDWPGAGSIHFAGVTASYSQATNSEAGKNVLSDVNLNIEAGEKFAVIGRTGSGKSTLALLLLRVLDPTPETANGIIVDGLQLRRIKRQTVRDRIIAVSQDMIFLAGEETYKSLLDPENKLTEDECQAALAEVGLGHVVSGAGNFHLPISKESLSHGQRQLLSLAVAVARAWARQKTSIGKAGQGTEQRPLGGIVILDELTSGVDEETENLMHSVISRVFCHHTVISITHKLESLAKYDAVYIVSQGRVINSQDAASGSF